MSLGKVCCYRGICSLYPSFDGEQYGDSTQLIYLRARYYNPTDGRFTARDTFAGYVSHPQTQNRFLYTQNNPIRYTDPTGHYSWEDFIAEGKSLINDPVQHTLDQIHKNQSMPWECTDVGQIALWAAPAIAPLIIVAAIPMILVSPDAPVDLAFMVHDYYMDDYQAFALDAMGLMIPGVTGLGMFSHADDAYRAVNAFDNLYETTHLTNSFDNVYDEIRYSNGFVDELCLNSFSADTDVATDKGGRDISEIQIGDLVLAWNETTGEISFEQVTDTIHHTDEVVIHLTIDNEELETTPEHPFYVEGVGWVNAEDLQIGDDIRNSDGKTGEVESIEAERTSMEMYNLTVDDAHTFYVGDGQWLVHNVDCNWLGSGKAPAWGENLAQTADNIYSKLSPVVKNNSTLGVTQIGDQSFVTITGRSKFHQQALDELSALADDLGINFVPNPDRTHAERLLYEQYRNTPGFTGIGISHMDGPCDGLCIPFFTKEGYGNIFWTGIRK